MFGHLAALGPFASLLAHCARAQTTDAVCLSSFSWMNNSKNQSPCLVSAYLAGACTTDGAWNVPSLSGDPFDITYSGPSAAQANPCTCSSVRYCMVSACALCQGHDEVSWRSWIGNCSAGLVSMAQFPMPIPPDTAVPAWAYQIVAAAEFNVTEARLVAQEVPPEPDSTAPPSPSSSAPTPTLSLTTSELTIPSSSSSSPSTSSSAPTTTFNSTQSTSSTSPLTILPPGPNGAYAPTAMDSRAVLVLAALLAMIELFL